MTRKINPEHDVYYVYVGNFSITSFELDPAFDHLTVTTRLKMLETVSTGNRYFSNLDKAKIFQLTNILYNERGDTWYSEWEKHSAQDIKNMQDELDALNENYPEYYLSLM